MKGQSVADVEGPWSDPSFESSLIQCCRRDWNIPVTELANESLARFLRQRLGLSAVIPEVRRRVEAGVDDDSELYEGQLANALHDACGSV